LKTPYSCNRRNQVLFEKKSEIKTDQLLTQIGFYRNQFKNVQVTKLGKNLLNRNLPIQRGIPYLMLQPIMSNRREYKVVLFNHVVQHTAGSYTEKAGYPFSKENLQSMVNFAEDSLRYCKNQCPFMITDGLVRVDIFENQSGQLVVNELESLEAGYEHIKINVTGNLNEKLKFYWKERLIKYINKCLSSKIMFDKLKENHS